MVATSTEELLICAGRRLSHVQLPADLEGVCLLLSKVQLFAARWDLTLTNFCLDLPESLQVAVLRTY